MHAVAKVVLMDGAAVQVEDEQVVFRVDHVHEAPAYRHREEAPVLRKHSAQRVDRSLVERVLFHTRQLGVHSPATCANKVDSVVFDGAPSCMCS